MVARHDCEQYGEEILPVPPDGSETAMQYAGYERDGSGMDYANARTYASGAGRGGLQRPTRWGEAPPGRRA